MNVNITGLKLARDGIDKAAPGQLSWTGAALPDWLEMQPKELSQAVCDFVEQQVGRSDILNSTGQLSQRVSGALHSLGAGSTEEIAISFETEAILKVAGTDESSSYDATSAEGLLIRPNETIASWWTTFNARHGSNVAPKIVSDGSGLDVDGTRIELHRTLRVPDDGKGHKLPPSLGTFPLEPVSKYAANRPPAIVQRGGYITLMYNYEALWISLPGYRTSAVKVSVGDINAITGLSKGMLQNPKDCNQDYLAPSQPWLDGIAKEPGSVRQFVAMNVKEGYTVEEQLTGKNSEATLEIPICPRNRTDFEVKALPGDYHHRTLNALGLAAELFGEGVKLQANYEQGRVKIFVRDGVRDIIPFLCEPSDTVWSIVKIISESLSVDPQEIRCLCLGHPLMSHKTLSDYDIQTGARLDLIFRQRGGGNPPTKEMGIAVGGQIKEKMYADENDASVYDFAGGHKVYIHAINAAHWKSITGRGPLHSEITKSTYKCFKTPWYEMYNEPEGLTNASKLLLALRASWKLTRVPL